MHGTENLSKSNNNSILVIKFLSFLIVDKQQTQNLSYFPAQFDFEQIYCKKLNIYQYISV